MGVDGVNKKTFLTLTVVGQPLTNINNGITACYQLSSCTLEKNSNVGEVTSEEHRKEGSGLSWV
ncbi:MAG: hypothetical protein BroJett042_04860 [Bacteroidota bacterium]|nr:MAG: hypothetical protein BroJett042_04860 [Bacteroidota bacterium]